MKQSLRNFLISSGLMIALAVGQIAVVHGYYVQLKDDVKSYSFELNPGEKASGEFTVGNNADKKITVKLYGADATSESGNIFAAKSDLEKQRTVGNWLHFDESKLDFEPQEKKKLKFTLEIPDKTPPGTYGGAVAVATINDTKTKENTMSVIAIQRYIFPVYVKVPGEEKTGYEWGNFYVDYGRNPLLKLTVKNTGNTLLNAEGTLVYNDLNSNGPAETQQIERAQLYGGDEITIEKAIEKTKTDNILNKYRAVATLNISRIDINTGEKLDTKTLTKELTFEINQFGPVYMGAAALLAIIALVLIYVLYKKFEKKRAQPYTVKEGETIEQIAKNLGCNWKKIAKLNKLHAPYSLKAGDTILTPPSRKK